MGFVCCFCGLAVPTMSGLSCHLKLVHASNSLTVFKCCQHDCKREYDSMRSFKKHLRNQHRNDEDQNLEVERGFNEQHNDMDIDDDDIDHAEPADNLEHNALHQDANGAIAEADITVGAFRNILSKSVMALTAKLYSSPSLNRTQVQNTIDHVKEFTGSGYLDAIKDKVISILSLHNAREEQLDEVAGMFEAMTSMFDGVDSEYQRVRLLERSQFYIRPIPYVISVGEEMRNIDGNQVLTPVELKGQYISMKQVLKKYLELPGNYTAIMRNVAQLKTSTKFTNFIQGSLWQHIETTHFGNKTVLPLHLYFDDVEPDSATGSHSGDHKIGAMYYQIPCIPQHLLSSLDHIFMSLVFSSNHRQGNNRAAFAPVLDDLQDLEINGLDISTDSGDHKVYFALGLILGDNLAQNGLLGFVESFSANYYCRFCRETKAILRAQFRENRAMLRNTINYDADVLLNDPSLTGIKERCIWNLLRAYDVTINLIVDLMHDLFEGICHYVLCAILNYILHEMNFFSIDTLNERIQNFDYRSVGGKKPTIITQEHIQKQKLKMTASEMMFFVTHLGLMIGDLVPAGDEVWRLYELLSQIIDILRAPFVRRNCCEYLAALIEEHNELYCRLFNTSLKPKFHFLTHYPRIMLMIGPVVHVWSMRLEGKHREVIKMTASNMTCRKNLPLSLAIKYSFSLCAIFLARNGFPPDVMFSSRTKMIRQCDNFPIFQNILLPGLVESMVATKAEICGTLYSQEMVIAFNFEDNLPLFGQIHWIATIRGNDDKAYFILNALYTIGFSEHLHAYEVQPSPEWICVEHGDLVSFHPSVMRTGANGRTYVVFSHVL